MKPAKTTLALVVVLAGIVASESVLAARGGGRGGGGGGRSGHSSHSGHSQGHPASHARGVIVGGAVFLPGYYYPPYAPPVAMQTAPWGYIEQGTDSYYCANTQKNYPDTQDCPGPWQMITPVPAPGS